MAETVLVKLKDTNGQFHIYSQGVTIRRHEVLEVGRDAQVAQALAGGGLLVATEDDRKAYEAKKADMLAKEKAKVAKPAPTEDAPATTEAAGTIGKEEDENAFTADQAKALFADAVAKEKASDKEGEVSILKQKFDTVDAAVEALLNNEKLRNATLKAIV